MRICPDELPAVSAAIATALCKNMSVDEIHVWRSLFIAIATEMSSVATARHWEEKCRKECEECCLKEKARKSNEFENKH